MHITVKHEITNPTVQYLIVGNCTDVISAHDTNEEAIAAIRNVQVTETKWASARIVAPGETASCELWATVPVKPTNAVEPMFDAFFEASK